MMTRLAFRRPKHGASRGQVLVIFAISSVALFGILALAFDGGRVLMEQRNLQNAADGAALTGALEIGPGTSPVQSHLGKDDAVYAIEEALGISFSNNYTTTQEHYLNAGSGSNCSPLACSIYNDACCTWTDSTGAYTLTITTPYNWNGLDNEAFIHVDVVHRLSLLIAGDVFPTLAVHVQATARNYALPFALYTLKYYDPADYQINGAATLTANKKMGTNGGLSTAGAGAHVAFNCTALASGGNGYGGDLYEYVPSGTGGIGAGSVTTGCISASGDFPTAIQNLPPLHLPLDPYGAAALPAVTNIAVPSGTWALKPTIPADPSASPGPRYGSVTVGSSTTLILMPGVYFFEGTASAGLATSSGTAAVETGDCYGYMAPSCWTTTTAGNPLACPSGFNGLGGVTLSAAGGLGSLKFACKTPDFGVLLVFYPAGSDITPTNGCTGVNPAASLNYYCYKNNSTAGNANAFTIWAGSTLYLSSSPRYHNVALYVDFTNAFGTTHNFTSATSLANASCATTACADHIGLGSNVLSVGGGGVISVLGAIVAPDDNVSLGGGISGSGYGQIISYTLSTQGASPLVESYNPAALAYAPVIVQ
jgi:Putative Flp pilus-assembly TadE/G-like